MFLNIPTIIGMLARIWSQSKVCFQSSSALNPVAKARVFRTFLSGFLCLGIATLSGCGGGGKSPFQSSNPAGSSSAAGSNSGSGNNGGSGSSSAPSITLTTAPTAITIGSSTTLTWSAANASSVTIDNGIGAVAATGSVTIRPGGSVTYHAVATGPGGSTQASAAVTVSPFSHVAVLVEENHSYSGVIGSSAMPYLNGLAAKYGLATQYYANTHPSIGNYFMMTTGQIITNDDNYSQTVDVDNIARRLLTAGKTWKCYAEDLPNVGYTGGDVNAYARHHNPFAYFSDVLNSSSEQQNLVPFLQFAPDLANGQLPNFSFIVPNKLNDAHDGTLQQADAWLQNNIAPLISNPSFQQGGLLIIVFDEADMSDSTNGGGHVAMVMISANGKPAFQSTTLYQHQSTLKSVLELMGVNSFPGSAWDPATPDMMEFLK